MGRPVAALSLALVAASELWRSQYAFRADDVPFGLLLALAAAGFGLAAARVHAWPSRALVVGLVLATASFALRLPLVAKFGVPGLLTAALAAFGAGWAALAAWEAVRMTDAGLEVSPAVMRRGLILVGLSYVSLIYGALSALPWGRAAPLVLSYVACLVGVATFAVWGRDPKPTAAAAWIRRGA
ncbi:MAG: hypothetical protein QOJ26_218 [Thermoplasmata archaeon]|jgi:hypothetical protein|nr:hypothetical protein [Thermoplasmata archaeon]MEA3165374.1 hypothetical protein [Thermoplasmata archaeon]